MRLRATFWRFAGIIARLRANPGLLAGAILDWRDTNAPGTLSNILWDAATAVSVQSAGRFETIEEFAARLWRRHGEPGQGEDCESQWSTGFPMRTTRNHDGQLDPGVLEICDGL